MTNREILLLEEHLNNVQLCKLRSHCVVTDRLQKTPKK